MCWGPEERVEREGGSGCQLPVWVLAVWIRTLQVTGVHCINELNKDVVCVWYIWVYDVSVCCSSLSVLPSCSISPSPHLAISRRVIYLYLLLLVIVSKAFLMDQSSRCTRSVVLESDCSTLLTLNMDSYISIQVLAVSPASALQKLQHWLLIFSKLIKSLSLNRARMTMHQ